MTDGSELSRSLRLARPAFEPTSEQRARVRAALAARLGPAGGAKSSGDRGAGAAGAQVAAAIKAAALLGVGFALGYWFAESRAPEVPTARRDRPVAVGVPVTAPAPRADAEPSPSAPASRATGTAAPAPARSVARLMRRARPASPDARAVEPDGTLGAPARATAVLGAPARPAPGSARLGEELGLLQRAERAIRAGDGALARSFVAELEARFPETTLGEERAAVLALAACVLGEPDAAVDAEAFLARHPGSVYFDRLRALCGEQGPSTLPGPTDRPGPDTDRRGGKP